MSNNQNQNTFRLTLANDETLEFNTAEELTQHLRTGADLGFSTVTLLGHKNLALDTHSLEDVQHIVALYAKYKDSVTLSRFDDVISQAIVRWSNVEAWTQTNFETRFDLGGRGYVDHDDVYQEFGEYLINEKLKTTVHAELWSFLDVVKFARSQSQYVVIKHNQNEYSVYRK